MCAVSAIGDEWMRRRAPLIDPMIWTTPSDISRTEFDALKRELEELKKKLKVAKQEDIDNGEPDCEMEEKISLLRQLGKLMDIDFDEVFKKNDDS